VKSKWAARSSCSWVAVAVVVGIVSASHAPAQCKTSDYGASADSVAAVFDSHQFVLIGSTHGGEKQQDFLLCLLSRPAFQNRVTDVLVEWANPVYQGLVDRYLLQLDEVPSDSLRLVWFDTDAPHLWARLPLIPQFYAAVRAINEKLPLERRIRVLGGCEPIDWSKVRTTADVASCSFKNNWAAHVITEHFATDPKRRLLVVYGEGHIYHNGGNMMGNLGVSLARDQLFVVGTIAALDPKDAEPAARLGDTSRLFFLDASRFPAAGPYPRALFYVQDHALAYYIDAVVFLGPEPDRDLTNQIALTAHENDEIARRDAIKGDLRQLLQLRLGARDRWFRSHPHDLPRDPRR